MSQPAFGRRAPRQPAPRGDSVQPVLAPVQPQASLDQKFDVPSTSDMSVDEELAEWKRSRRYILPWRQISLMATLSFGIASLVMPDSVNEPVEWLLYALTAVSMISTVAAWWKKLTHVV